MARRRKGVGINGWINLNKPAGITSTHAVNLIKRILNPQKIGHGGTLDPLADGVLPIALGEATKTISYCQDALKTYRFTLSWGEFRTTDDREGEVCGTSSLRPSREDINACLPAFTGEIMQVPPQFSAIKVNGERAYDIARSGENVALLPRPVYIETLEIVETGTDFATLRCLCGKGTYIRSLARDLAGRLGTAGHVSALRRESVGAMPILDAISLESLQEIADSARLADALLPVETMLDDIPALALNDQEAARLKQGQKLSFIYRLDVNRLEKAGIAPGTDMTALATSRGTALGLVAVKGTQIQPLRILNL